MSTSADSPRSARAIPHDRIVALVDCSAFYCACERVFRPDLDDRPIVVLSNNDGCIIARNQEAKDLGIAKMGQPYFQIRDQVERAGVAVFSSNYTLYADMSRRVMETLETFSDDVERYSIDEAFLLLPRLRLADMEALAADIRRTVFRWTRIPVRVSVAPTKALAKAASELARAHPSQTCVLLSSDDDALARIPVGDVWGVGRRYRSKLEAIGIRTARDLKHMDPAAARKLMTVQGERLVRELRGTPCIAMEYAPPPQRAICRSRSFGRRITTQRELVEAVMTRLSEAAAKARRHGLTCGYLSVFVSTGPHARRRYGRSLGARLPAATNFTPDLARVADTLLERLYQPGFEYKQAGVLLTDLADESAPQTHLFEAPDPSKRALSSAVDALNRCFGRHTVALASQGTDRAWEMNRKLLSPAYTTSPAALPTLAA
jgi:DNA polymerase V